MLFQSSSISLAWCSKNLDWKIISILHTSHHLCNGAVLGGDQAGAEALGHGGLKGHGGAV